MLILYAIVMLVSVFLFIRNEWVLKERISVIENNYQLYEKLPSYDYMVLHFWIWDIEKFKGVNNE